MSEFDSYICTRDREWAWASKPRVRQLRRAGDPVSWLITYNGKHRICSVSSAQQVSPNIITQEAEYQIKRLINQIERETNA